MQQQYDHITDGQVEVTRLPTKDKSNYRIAAGNPLTGDCEFSTTASWLKIDGVGFSGEIKLSEYETEIGIVDGHGSCEIYLDV